MTVFVCHRLKNTCKCPVLHVYIYVVSQLIIICIGGGGRWANDYESHNTRNSEAPSF